MKVIHSTAISVANTNLVLDAFITKLCAQHSHDEDPLLAALDHHLAGGGNRTRAHICHRASISIGLTEEEALCLAASVECLHNASLVQDDLQDRSPIRRGRSAIWKLYGNDTALCLTDLLLSAAYAALGSLPPTERLGSLVSYIHSSVSKTLRGQMKDTIKHLPNKRVDASLENALTKSGPFFVAALELPLIAAGVQEHLSRARIAAENFGLGYQIYDDVTDLNQDMHEGNQHNIVLALTESTDIKTATRQAASMACSYLRKAAKSARLLPHGSGEVLAEQAEIVIEKFRAFS